MCALCDAASCYQSLCEDSLAPARLFLSLLWLCRPPSVHHNLRELPWLRCVIWGLPPRVLG